MTSIELGGVIIAITEGLKRIVPQISGVYTIIVAGVLGVLAGLAGIGDFTWVSGLFVGLAASGSVTMATKISAK